MLHLMMLPHNVIYDVDDLTRTLALPKSGIQLAGNEEAQLVQETGY